MILFILQSIDFLTGTVHFVTIFSENARQSLAPVFQTVSPLARLHAFAAHPATSEVKALSNEGFHFARVPGIAQERYQENSSFPVEESSEQSER